jgi:hypothetical protein
MSDQPLPPDFSWTADFVNERLSKLDQNTAPAPAPPTLGSLHATAAVLAHYDPSALQALAASQGTPDKIEDVLNSSTVVYADGRPQSMLKTETRRAALEQLGGQAAIRRTLQSVTERPKTTLQRILDGYVLGRPKLLDLQSLDELAASLQVTNWFSGLLDNLPAPRDLERRIEREALLKPFKDLAGESFAGRQAELSDLRTYVGFLDAATGLESLARGFRQLVTGYKPMVIHAPGGMGKSTLVAKFILEHLEPTGLYPALPFAYLDFDRPVVLPEKVPTLLAEAARQLDVHLDVRGSEDEPGRTVSRLFPADLGPDQAISVFADLVRRLGIGDAPILFVLDTFEEVQYRGLDIVEGVLGFFKKLQEAIPAVRVVVVGRAAVSSTRVPVDNRPLGPLKADDAAKYLNERGIDDPQIARRVADQVGGSPLSLRLALEVIERDEQALGASGVTNLNTRNKYYLRLSDGQIQGQLYRRILGHITNPDIRKLAHPGLVLRRVTAEIILEVLAKPCDVTVTGIDHARTLLGEMQREVSLVTLNEDGSLQHLPELRAIMLNLLKEDRPVQVSEIQERAVEYYKDKTKPAEIAERVYHMLMLGRDRAELDAAWQPGIERFLRSAVDEVPPTVKPYLSARLGDPVDKSVLASLDRRDVELRIAGRVRDLMASRRLEEVAQLLKSQPERSKGSVLHLADVESSILMDDSTTAYNQASSALAEAAHFVDPLAILKLEVARAWAARRATVGVPKPSLDDVERIFARFQGEPLALRCALHRLAATTDTWTRNAMKSSIALFVPQVPEEKRQRYPYLRLEVTGLIGTDVSEIVAVLSSFILSGATEPRQRSLLQAYDALAAWDRAEDGRLGWKERMEHTGVLGAAQLVISASAVYQMPDAVKQALAALFTDVADRWRTDWNLYNELERVLSSDANRETMT